MTGPRGPGLRIAIEGTPVERSVRLSGELDISSAQRLETAIAELCAEGAKRIVLETSALAFMDSTGLRAVLVGAELCAAGDCELLIGETSRQVERLLAVSGIGERLPRTAKPSGSPADEEQRAGPRDANPSK